MRFLTQRISGVQRFAYEICVALDGLIKKYPYITIIGLMPNSQINPQYSINFTHFVIKKVGFLRGHLWEQIELPIYSLGKPLLNLCNPAPMLKFDQFITLHDVIFMTGFDSQKWWFRAWYKLIAKIVSRTSKQIFTVSNFSKKEITEYLHVKPGKITVLGNASSLINYSYDLDILDNLKIKDKQYFIIIGSNSKRKNIRMVTELFASHGFLSDYYLVVVGGDYVNLIPEHTIESNNIIYTGYISDGSIRSLYKNALALIIPSLYEGFGVPIVEALSEGIPVIASDIPVFHEVLRGLIYFDPYDRHDLLEKIKYLLICPPRALNIKEYNIPERLWDIYANILLQSILENVKK